MPRLVGITAGVVQRVAAGAVISQATIDYFGSQYTSVVTVPDASAALRVAEGEAWNGTQSVATPATIAYEAALADDALEQSRMAVASGHIQALTDFANGVTTPANLTQMIAVVRPMARVLLALFKRELRKDARGG